VRCPTTPTNKKKKPTTPPPTKPQKPIAQNIGSKADSNPGRKVYEAAMQSTTALSVGFVKLQMKCSMVTRNDELEEVFGDLEGVLTSDILNEREREKRKKVGR
jgi:hypothetical protein